MQKIKKSNHLDKKVQKKKKYQMMMIMKKMIKIENNENIKYKI